MDILDVIEIGNAAQVVVDEWAEEFMKKFMKPVNELAMKAAAQQVMAQPEMVKEMLREKNPEQYANLQRIAGEMGGE